MKILAIETSCDDCSAAVIEGGRRTLSSIVSGQDDLHARFGGIVPEVACRKHIETITAVVRAALADAGIGAEDIEGVAATSRPGLIGSLLVGFIFAKAFAWGRGLPFRSINHLFAHLTAIFLETEVAFPYLGLIVSGGHTSLFRVDNFDSFTELSATRDDAAGEAFDKVAGLLGLGYPGGAVIDRLATAGDSKAIKFPRAMISDPSLDFSFSGLKTSVAVYLEKHGLPADESGVADIAAGFQQALVDVLAAKTIRAAKESGLNRIVISGGVAANSRLRRDLSQAASEAGLEIFLPSRGLCTDNAAMLGPIAEFYLKQNHLSSLTENAYAGMK